MFPRPPLDARQEADAARRIEDSAWVSRQSMPRRVAIWLVMSAAMAASGVLPIAALSGRMGMTTWFWWSAVFVVFAVPLFFSVFRPVAMARFAASWTNTEAEEQRLRDLPPQHPGRIP